MSEAEVESSFYNLLGVDRDAPFDLIRENYRRLMQQAGNHPDLGGDTRTAALINKAYAILSDPVQRGEYDLRLDVLERVTTGFEVEPGPEILGPRGECPFCQQPTDRCRHNAPEIGCENCGSPLHAVENLRIETSDARAVQRVGKELDITFFTHWRQAQGFAARTEDLSPYGLRMVTRRPIHRGQRIRLIGNMLDAVGVITHCVPRQHGWRTENVAGVAFLTLRFMRSVGGFVSRRV